MIEGRKPYRQQTKSHDKRDSIFTARVVLPTDVDRDEYIRFALRTHSVCLLTAQGDFIRNAPMAYSFMGSNEGFIHSMEFPQSSSELGTEVVVLNIPKHNIPIVIGCLPRKEGTEYLNNEDMLRMKRVTVRDDGTASSFTIEGDGIQGLLKLISYGVTESGGKVKVRATNKQKKGEITMRTNYWKMFVTNDIEITAKGNVLWTIEGDSEYNITGNSKKSVEGTYEVLSEGEMKLNSEEKVRLGESSEPVLLGDTKKSLDEELLTALSSAVILTPIGQGSFDPATIANFETVKGKLQTALSKKVETE